ncbi:LamG-like jellyroll fold domain-containing protein [Pinibacter aurantiacus]|uniref:DUF6443 domain-containing protein n=1 Tax=Pinibacter aurantiacus TaxID=2851599 RepID=A0A9E2SB57_9BACT|nr:LamG-like jellyroll fold domain-containing protein [Pinibacter aurantiacus]MBV4358902.1 hypothetical protein [Pinibacter aurantiacus]
MLTQYFPKKLATTLVLLFAFAAGSFAATESYIQTLTGNIKKGDSCIVIDDKFINLPLEQWNQVKHLSVNNLVSFELRSDTSIYYYNKPFTCTLNVTIKYFTSRDQQSPTEIDNVNLAVRYDTIAGKTYPSIAQYKFKNAFKVIVVVNSITSKEWGKDIPAIFRLKNQILVERKYPFTQQVNVPLSFKPTQTLPALGFGMQTMTTLAPPLPIENSPIEISWIPSHFAEAGSNPEEYDLEWTYIDDQILEQSGSRGDLLKRQYKDVNTGFYNVPENVLNDWMKNDNSRITTPKCHYSINLPYTSGFIIARMRGVSYELQGSSTVRKTTNWQSKNNDGYTYVIEIGENDAHESTLNWQFTAAFAEEGKRKDVISYFDGSMRNRQSVTINTSDDKAVVQESVYDNMGRPSVSILPAPTTDNRLQYYNGFNKNNSGQSYDYTNIGKDCQISADPLSTSSGTSRYYSPSNDFISAANQTTYQDYYFTKYVPDAGGYPFSTTQYTPDNTGRIKKQGGVGQSFQINSGHETQYFYGKPSSQRELDRLFGMEAGNFSHYLKNMVIDPNGQTSISYIDANGKTVATALAGDKAPGNLDALSSIPSGAITQLNDEIIQSSDFKVDAGNLFKQATATFLAETKGAFKLFYTINPAALTTVHSGGKFCSSCSYNVVIEIKDDCGTAVAPKVTTTAFQGNDVNCNSNPTVLTGQITTDELTPGSYNITYTLQLSEDNIKYQTDYYIANNADLKKLQNFFETELSNLDLTGCYNDCATCKLLGTAVDDPKSNFRQKVMDVLSGSKFKNLDPSSAFVQNWITTTWNTLHTRCQSLSCAPASPCEEYLTRMKMDVMPGGQYARYSVDEVTDAYTMQEPTINVMRFYKDATKTDIYNLTYTDDDGITVKNARDLPESEFIKKYIEHPEWADKFVIQHIEYCGYQWCKDQNNPTPAYNNEVSYGFDRSLRETYTVGQDAVDKGFYNRNNIYALLNNDPFFWGSGRGYAYRQRMQFDLDNFSNAIGMVMKNSSHQAQSSKNILQLIDWMLYCKPATVEKSDAGIDAMAYSWNNCSPDASCRSLTREWELYRNYYLQLKSKYVEIAKQAAYPNCKNCFIGTQTALGCQGSSTFVDCPTADDFEFSFVLDAMWEGEGPYDYTGHYYVTLTHPVNRQVTVNLGAVVSDCPGCEVGDGTSRTVTLEAGQTSFNIEGVHVVFIQMGQNYQQYVTTQYYVQSISCDNSAPQPVSSCPTDANYANYKNKTRIWNDYVYYEGSVECSAANGSPYPTSEASLQPLRDSAILSLNQLKTGWLEQLQTVRDEEFLSYKTTTLSDDVLTTLVNNLYQLAKNNIQNATSAESIRAASTLSDGSSFNAIFESTLGLPIVKKGFSAELLAFPYPYDRTPISVNENISEIKEDVRDRVLAMYGNASQGNSSISTFHTYLKTTLGEDYNLTQDQLNDLVTRCNQNCRYLSESLIIPVAFSTPPPPSTGYSQSVAWTDLNNLINSFKLYYSAVAVDSKLYNVLLQNYLNHKLGYTLSLGDYLDFLNAGNSSAVLFNKAAYKAVPSNDFGCVADNLAAAYERGAAAYELYIEVERKKFRNAYVAKCLSNTATGLLQGKQYEYHFTLYYYDQAGNLVKTIPPAGVELLTDEQINTVQTYRKMFPAGNGAITPCSAYPAGGYTTVESAISSEAYTVFQNNTSRNIEFWLYNSDPTAPLQGRVYFTGADPNSKYMCQVAIANKKLWVELYELLYEPSTQSISILRSSHGVADISGVPLQNQVLVSAQSAAGLMSGDLNLFVNGVALSVLPVSAGNGFPFDWSIQDYTAPEEQLSAFKHLRLYDRELTSDEMAANYTNGCMAPNGALASKPFPLQVWGMYNQPSACNPTSTATVINKTRTTSLLVLSDTKSSWAENVIFTAANNFTVELWAKPIQTHEIDPESYTSNTGTSGQKYAIYPVSLGSTTAASVGVSVGTNGVSVYERSSDYFSPVIVWEGPVTTWTHIAIVYTNRTPTLYINGVYKKTGTVSTRSLVLPSYNIGGGEYGTMSYGTIDEVRIWDRARTSTEISSNYNNSVLPNTPNLVGLWIMSSTNGQQIKNSTCNSLNSISMGAWGGYTTADFIGLKTLDYAEISTVTIPFVVPNHRLPTNYVYNSLNQVVSQTTPDAGTSQFWYDRLGRLSASQNAEQLAPSVTGEFANRYSYTKYDKLGRIVEVGEKTGVQETNYLTEEKSRDEGLLQVFYNGGNNRKVTVTAYDEAPTWAPAGILQRNLRKRVAATALLSFGSDANTNRDAASYYSYDQIGNVDLLTQENTAMANQEKQIITGAWGLKQIKYDYDLISGKVNKVSYQPGKWDQFFYKYTYDAENRLIGAQTSSDEINWITEAAYRYYLHGPLARMQLGQNNVQGLDYAYTLQGWIKGINGSRIYTSALPQAKDMNDDGFATSSFGPSARDVFGYTLGYYSNDYTPISSSATAFNLKYNSPALDQPVPGSQLFNGNISNATYAIGKIDNGTTIGYSYRYDQLNRLTKMRQNATGTGTTWNYQSPEQGNDPYMEDVGYDANGNIATYTRNGAADKPAMDKLTYSYNVDANGKLVNNKLRHVHDEVNEDNYSTDIDSQTEDDAYNYDKIGNLVKDISAENGLDKIKWTVYGKIESVSKANGNIITYTYDAGGNRISKSVATVDGTTITHYVRDAQGNTLGVYEYKANNNVVIQGKWLEQQLYGSSRLGMVTPNVKILASNKRANDSYDPNNDHTMYAGKRQYELTNHLGNVMATINDVRTGIAVQGSPLTLDHFEANIMTAQDYYPFGMIMPGRNFAVPAVNDETDGSGSGTGGTGTEEGHAPDPKEDWVSLKLSGSKNPSPYPLSTLISDVQNTFTVEFWVKPTTARAGFGERVNTTNGWGMPSPAVGGSSGTLIDATNNTAATSIAVGTNGVTVGEFNNAYYSMNLVWDAQIRDWTHIAVVYNNKVPSLYINGQLVHTGLASSKATVIPSSELFGNSNGSMGGNIADVRIWNFAKTAAQIQANIERGKPKDVTGLVCYYPLNEGSGTVANDASGHNRSQTLVNSATWSNGTPELTNVVKSGVDNTVTRSSLQLSGQAYTDGNYIASVGDNFTMEFWAKPTSTHEIDVERNYGGLGTSGQKYAIGPATLPPTGLLTAGAAGVSVGTNGVSVYESGGTSSWSSVLVWPGSVTGWTHIAVVYKNRQPRLYINGVLVKTGQVSSATYVMPSYSLFGCQYGTMDGQMAEVRIWSESRTQEEIVANMNKTMPKNSEWLVGYWPMNEASGTTIADQSGYNRNLTIANSAQWVSGTSDKLPVLNPTNGSGDDNNGSGGSGSGSIFGTAYRYGFNGKEKDNEVSGDGNQYDYGFRIYNPRVGRFLSVDPLQEKYPELTPYQFASNSPIQGVDLDGREIYHYTMIADKQGNAVLKNTLTEYKHGHSFFGLFYWETTIDVKRYVVDYEGKTYHIGFPLTGSGLANGWKTEDFENDYIKKPGRYFAFGFEYVDDAHSEAQSYASRILNAQNYSAETAIPMETGDDVPIPSKATNKVAASVHGGNTEAATANNSAQPTVTYEGQTYEIKAKTPYKRPNNATTPAQRKAVNQPNSKCATCGTTQGPFVADHIEPLAIEHISTGTIDKKKMRSLGAVQSQCENCSSDQSAAVRKASQQANKVIKNKGKTGG